MSNQPNVCEKSCEKNGEMTAPVGTRLIVITGGPGAGKTAVLEMAKKVLCERVAILPEAASIIFGGGFWRLPSVSAKQAAQRAIFQVQIEMENLVMREHKWTAGLCDRGSLDGLAYWEDTESSFWEMSRSDIRKEYAKYFAVIHLRSPTDLLGYNQQNPLRTETALQSKAIDARIAQVWVNHPNYEVIESSENFLTKAQSAIKLISKHLPECCGKNLADITSIKT